jgi:hypothetical protein
MLQQVLNEMPVDSNVAVGRAIAWMALWVCTPFTIGVLAGTLAVLLPWARIAIFVLVVTAVMFTAFWALAPLHETQIQLVRYLIGRQESLPSGPILPHPEWLAAPVTLLLATFLPLWLRFPRGTGAGGSRTSGGDVP